MYWLWRVGQRQEKTRAKREIGLCYQRRTYRHIRLLPGQENFPYIALACRMQIDLVRNRETKTTEFGELERLQRNTRSWLAGRQRVSGQRQFAVEHNHAIATALPYGCAYGCMGIERGYQKRRIANIKRQRFRFCRKGDRRMSWCRGCEWHGSDRLWRGGG